MRLISWLHRDAQAFAFRGGLLGQIASANSTQLHTSKDGGTGVPQRDVAIPLNMMVSISPSSQRVNYFFSVMLLIDTHLFSAYVSLNISR